MITLFIQHGPFGHFSSQRCFTEENGYLNFLCEVTASFSLGVQAPGIQGTLYSCTATAVTRGGMLTLPSRKGPGSFRLLSANTHLNAVNIAQLFHSSPGRFVWGFFFSL